MRFKIIGQNGYFLRTLPNSQLLESSGAICPPSSSWWLCFYCAIATLVCEKKEEGEGRKQKTDGRKKKAEDTSAARMFCLCDANYCC